LTSRPPTMNRPRFPADARRPVGDSDSGEHHAGPRTARRPAALLPRPAPGTHRPQLRRPRSERVHTEVPSLAGQRYLRHVEVRAVAVRADGVPPSPGAVPGDVDGHLHHHLGFHQEDIERVLCSPVRRECPLLPRVRACRWGRRVRSGCGRRSGTAWCCAWCTAGGPLRSSGPAAWSGAR
jgi:hypothetical protein